jgi:predicted aldo/keto reductase-like oxidoreductase
MEDLKDDGLVKNWGISLPFESPNYDDEIFDEPIDFFQVHYNILQQQNKETINYLKQKNEPLRPKGRSIC